jgi:hypothetical protein
MLPPAHDAAEIKIVRRKKPKVRTAFPLVDRIRISLAILFNFSQGSCGGIETLTTNCNASSRLDQEWERH